MPPIPRKALMVSVLRRVGKGKSMSIVMKFDNVKQLDKAIKQIIIGAKNQREMIQQIAIGIVSHAANRGNGNVSRAKVLVDGLGEGVRCDSLVAWFALVGITFDEETGKVSLDKSKLTPENFTEAKKVMWFQAKKAPNPYKGMTFEDNLVNELKAMYKAAAFAAEYPDQSHLVKMTSEQLTTHEAYVKSMVGEGNMPAKPAILKINSGNVTAIGRDKKIA